MARHCFKRKFGYVNMTPDAIYLTSTGNWTEIDRLAEKSKASIKKNAWRKTRIKLFLYPSLLVFAGIVISEISHLNLMSVSLIAGIAGGVALIKYFSSDLGNVYKIPVDKIIRTEINETDVTIFFLDSEGKPTEEEIFELENEAIEKLAKWVNEFPTK